MFQLCTIICNKKQEANQAEKLALQEFWRERKRGKNAQLNWFAKFKAWGIPWGGGMRTASSRFCSDP